MILIKNEKASIYHMTQDDNALEFADYERSNYQYVIDLPSKNEYRVSKFAIMCLAVEYFKTPEEVISYIEN